MSFFSYEQEEMDRRVVAVNRASVALREAAHAVVRAAQDQLPAALATLEERAAAWRAADNLQTQYFEFQRNERRNRR